MLSVTGVETALACSENEPTTSSEISVSPIDNSDPIQFNKRSLSDEDRLKLLQTKWIPPSNSYIFPKNDPVLVRYGNKFVVSWIFTGVILKGNAERTVNQEYSFSHDLL
jgi:hypothetical protein